MNSRKTPSSSTPNWRVNMTASQIRAWLRTAESKSVGFTYPGAGESVGHASGKTIARILDKGGPRSPDLTEAERKHVRKVAGYNARHLAQRPSGDVSKTRWRYSLMNWGHDPLRRGKL